uniref:Uncharacterized protein n=1 Tax=Triticum urartu TaxID=4572 RepID=A0A8R7R3U4_TRIUA
MAIPATYPTRGGREEKSQSNPPIRGNHGRLRFL